TADCHRRSRPRHTRLLLPRPWLSCPRCDRRRWASPPRARAGRAKPGVDGPLRAARRRAGRAARRRRARLGAREAPAGRARGQPLTSQRQTTETETGARGAPDPRRHRMQLCMRLCAAILAAGVLTAAAEEQPWTLEASNWEKGKDLLPEPVVKRLQKGEYWFKVVSADPSRFHHNYSQAFWDASEKNAGRYGLDEKTCGLKDKATDKIPDFVFGLPFPQLDNTDAKAGCRS